MKNAQTDSERRRPWGWVIDPIKSFFMNGSGGEKEMLFPEGPNEKPFEDETLWKAGKRAFDIIHDRCQEEAETKDELGQIILDNAEELKKFYNGLITDLNPLIDKGKLRIISEDTGESIAELEPLTVDPKKFGALYTIEHALWNIDEMFERLALQAGEINFPYDREYLAALFTLAHVDDSALGHVFPDAHQPDAHTWATRWFEKIDNFERTNQAIKERQAQDQRAKSQAMNAKRHSKRNEAMQLVTDDWSQRKNDFRSAERAGIHYADWLESRGFEYEPRTITTWIRKYAKDNGIKLR